MRLAELADDQLAAPSPQAEIQLADLCQAFELALGWRLELGPPEANNQRSDLMWSAPAEPGVGTALRLVKVAPDRKLAGPRGQSPLARRSLWPRQWPDCGAKIVRCAALVEREAELTADIPVVARNPEPAETAQRLAAVLQAGAEAVGCQAAGLYLLDSATTSLKLRACWGLSERKLAAPPRPLRALADLEALLGHAVVLAEPALFDDWRAPEQRGAAVCVPVSSSTTPLGTLWVFSHATRDFSAEQTHLLEAVACRLAAELERDVLVADARTRQEQTRDLDAAAQRTAESLPRVAPLVEGWKVAGRILGPGPADGVFFDWFAAAGGRLALSLGAADQPGLRGVLAAAELRSALRALGPDLARSSQALVRAHEVLGGISAEGAGLNALCGLLDPARDTFRFAAAGAVGVLLRDASAWTLQGEPAPPLGTLEKCRSSSYRGG